MSLEGYIERFDKGFIKQYNGSLWLKIFYHYNPEGRNPFINEYEAQYCINNENKFSILLDLDEKFKINGHYEFMIEYPQLNTYNRWQQSNNPINEDECTNAFGCSTTAIGFKRIETKAESSSWGGLVKTKHNSNYKSPPSLLNGTPGRSDWFFAIGQYKNTPWLYNSTTYSNIPSNAQPVDVVLLWLRLPDKKYDTCKNYNMIIPKYCLFISLLTLKQ